MNKRIIILIVVFIVAAVSVVAYAVFQGSSQKVKLTFDNSSGSSLNIYKRKGTSQPLTKDGGSVHSLKESGSFTLQKGEYVIEPVGKDIDTKLIELSVKDSPIDKIIVVNRSTANLEELLNKEASAITKVITSQYKNVQDLYIINPGKLYGKGDWYGTSLVYKGDGQDNRDTLHIILHKTDGSWVVAAKPQILISVIENKDIPDSIIRDINMYKPVPSQAPPLPTPEYSTDDGSPGAL